MSIGNSRPVLLMLLCCSLLLGCSGQSPLPQHGALEPEPALDLATLDYAPDYSEQTSQCESDCRPENHVTTASTRPEVPRQFEDLWDRVREGFAFETPAPNARIDAQLKLYSSRQELLDRVSTRASLYMYHIVEELEQRQLPLELALLPIVESAYDPFAYSHGRASGLWQFIPSTGKRYGLRQNWWYDGRRDVLDSTRAALDYLQDLQQEFDGDWLLALAAYNTGEGKVAREIRRNQTAGLRTDFWSLSLPRETRAYVPKLLALAQIIGTPADHGVSLPAIDNKAAFVIADFDGQIDLAQAAELAGIDMNTLYTFNPAFNRWASDPLGPQRLLLPPAAAEPFARGLAALPAEQRISWQLYRIQRGDSLIRIARRHDTTPAALRSVNNLSDNLIRAGDTLLIPVASAGASHYSLSAGQRLATRQSSAVAGRQRQDYVVMAGDSLWSIARRHGVSSTQLARWNGMGLKDTLSVGHSLVIWQPAVSETGTATAAVSQQRDDLVRRIGYRVRSGDSLWRIARRFDLSVDEISKWNRIEVSEVLRPGQALTLYVDMRNAR